MVTHYLWLSQTLNLDIRGYGDILNSFLFARLNLNIYGFGDILDPL
jgi:hypothetical protein